MRTRNNRDHTPIPGRFKGQLSQCLTQGSTENLKVIHRPARLQGLKPTFCEHQDPLLASFVEARQDIGQLRIHGDKLIRRQGPRRRRPDRQGRSLRRFQIHLKLGRKLFWCSAREGHIHRQCGPVNVFHFRLGQRTLAVHTPEHRLRALMEMAICDHPAQRSDNIRFNMKVHGAVRIIPVAQNPKTLEIDALALNLARRIGTAGIPKRIGIRKSFTDFTKRCFHLVLNRKPMAIPTRHIGCVIPGQSSGFNNDVFQHFVNRVTDMNVSIRVWRTVMQDEGLLPGGLRLTNGLIPIPTHPICEHLGLTGRQIAPHRKRGVGQI